MDIITKSNIKPVFEDERGAIFDLLDKEKIIHIGMINSKKGSIRGNHYHKTAKQINYLLSGRIELTVKDMSREDSKPQKIIMERGDIVHIPKMFFHSLNALEDSTFLVFTDRQRGNGGYENDTHKADIYTSGL